MTKFKFSVGPWNVHEGADTYGPATRKTIPIEEKFKKFAELGFSAVQFHDDDAVPNINDYTEEEIKEKARQAQQILEQAAAMFAGGSLTDEDKIAFMDEIQSLYLDSKRRAKKFTPKKYLKNQEEK